MDTVPAEIKELSFLFETAVSHPSLRTWPWRFACLFCGLASVSVQIIYAQWKEKQLLPDNSLEIKPSDTKGLTTAYFDPAPNCCRFGEPGL